MLSSLLSGRSQEPKDELVLLVIQGDMYNWPAIMEGAVVKGRPVKVVQTGWGHITVGPCENYSKDKKRRCAVTVAETTEWGPDMERLGTKKRQTIFPEMLLIRNEVYTHAEDHRSKLFAFMYCNIPSVNTLQSIYMFCERPIIQGELNKLKDSHGDEFPAIVQAFAPSHRGFMYPLGFPAVVKVGAAHAGYGKMKITDHHQMDDFKSVLALTKGNYCMMEEFVEGDCDLRIQRIGDEVRAFTRKDVSGEWKTNTGTSICDEIPVTPEFQRWTDLAQPMFGGLDIFTVDAIRKPSGENVILEVNGTSSGLFPDTSHADNQAIRKLLLKRMDAL